MWLDNKPWVFWQLPRLYSPRRERDDAIRSQVSGRMVKPTASYIVIEWIFNCHDNNAWKKTKPNKTIPHLCAYTTELSRALGFLNLLLIGILLKAQEKWIGPWMFVLNTKWEESNKTRWLDYESHGGTQRAEWFPWTSWASKANQTHSHS